MDKPPIYLDHAATTPLKAEVLDAMMPYLTTDYGNASAVYGYGRKARHTIEKCRSKVAELIGVSSGEILFTSGGSESNNAVFSQPFQSILTSSIEHESVLEPVKRLSGSCQTLFIGPNQTGQIELDEVRRQIESNPVDGENPSNTGIASFMVVNNELGTINPIAQLAAHLKQAGYVFHTDAVQAAGNQDLKEITPHVDYLTLSGHKIGGPKGIGALFVRGGSPYSPLVVGGGQEQDRRAGTENVASIVGFTRALELSVQALESNTQKLVTSRQIVVDGLRGFLSKNIRFISPLGSASSPHIINFVCLDDEGIGLDGEMLILGLDVEGVYVSAGSACSSGTMKSSTVLKNMGVTDQVAKGAVRISISPETTEAELQIAVKTINKVVRRMIQSGKGVQLR